jgi:hypothetical protein
MTSKANLYQARVWNAYCEWCKLDKTQDALECMAQAYEVEPWDIELEHRTALDLD